jgi:hypothetical protein
MSSMLMPMRTAATQVLLVRTRLSRVKAILVLHNPCYKKATM